MEKEGINMKTYLAVICISCILLVSQGCATVDDQTDDPVDAVFDSIDLSLDIIDIIEE